MKIFNTMTKKKEQFVPLNEEQVKIYACGPTVYNYIHIGNARPICVCDVLRRYLEYLGFKVKFVQNFTDIDDKIIKKAIEDKTDYLSVSQKYINEYKIDSKGLNVKEATVHPKATENIKDIIGMIEGLIEKGFAYKVENGDVYFSTKKFTEYGKLSHQPLDALEAGARISVDEIKDDPMDFALWKSAKTGEPYWESPWGKGRPGWHIECSAMANKFLGKTIDIHYGGQDLIFPHHENEIAQSECFNGVEFARYWMHNGYINIDNKKMSKSLNNFFTVREIAEKYGYEPIRYLMISSHYRSPINYSEDIIKQCIASLDRLYTCKKNLEFTLSVSKESECVDEGFKSLLLKHKEDFIKSMNDDLNTADAITTVFELVRDINVKLGDKEAVSKESVQFALNLFNELTGVLGLIYVEGSSSLEEDIEKLIEKREQARKDRDFETADKIRDELKLRNIILEDTKNGVKWKKINC